MVLVKAHWSPHEWVAWVRARGATMSIVSPRHAVLVDLDDVSWTLTCAVALPAILLVGWEAAALAAWVR